MARNLIKERQVWNLMKSSVRKILRSRGRMMRIQIFQIQVIHNLTRALLSLKNKTKK